MNDALRLYQLDDDDPLSQQSWLFDGCQPMRRPAVPRPGDLTVADGVNRYLADWLYRVETEGYSRDAYENGRRDLLRFASAGLDANWRIAGAKLVEARGTQGSKVMSQCRQHDLIDFLRANPGWASDWSRKRVLGEILACFKWLEDDELIAKSPYRKPPTRKLRLQGERHRDAEADEYVLLMKHNKSPRELRRALFWLWNSGARPKEMRTLVINQVHLDRAVVIQEKHKTRKQQAQPKPRIFALTPRLKRFLGNLIRQLPPGQKFVFRTKTGKPWTRHNLDTCFGRYRDLLGLEKTLKVYSIRHTVVTEADEAGAAERHIADLVGHEGTALINRYSHARRKVKHLKSVAADIEKRRRELRRKNR